VSAKTLPAESRRPGRPRSARADAAILESTVETLVERGFAALSVEQVADRAGVSKATIYRRYPTKTDLVIAAMALIGQATAEAPDTGSVRGDLAAFAEIAQGGAGNDPRRLLAMPRLVSEAACTDPDLFDAVERSLIRPRRAAVRTALERGIERGELPSSLDLDVVTDMYVGPIVFHLLRTGGRGPQARKRRVEQFIDLLTSSLGKK
jgi:AcrR family transcriptional regulator